MVDYEQWNTDVENTIKEIEAYDMIATGFEMLSALPESEFRVFQIKAGHYRDLKNQCREFLAQLREFGAEQFGEKSCH